MQNQTISKLFIDDNKSKTSGNPTDILKFSILDFLAKYLIEKKKSNEQFHLCEVKISLDDVTFV